MFPPILNTTRLLATILAVPNAALIAAGLAQSAFDASLNHALSDCSASAYSGFSQNNRRVLREMIRIVECHYGTIPYWEQNQDVDLKAAVLTVRGAKFGKSRLLPLHASTCNVLAAYLARRQRFWAARPHSSYLFVSSRGNRLDGADIRRTFYALSRQIGLRGLADSHGPRLHDLRHRFAVKTLLHWYRAGEDAERRLPVLSAYLGHVHVADTYWYLSAWPGS